MHLRRCSEGASGDRLAMRILREGDHGGIPFIRRS
jgi:hypothetical protein